MGRTVCQSVAGDPDLELVAAVDESGVGAVASGESDVKVRDRMDALVDAVAEVAVDFTHPDAVMDNVRWLVEHHVHAVVVTTGVRPDDFAVIERLLEHVR